jgi:hypothetical protein
MVDLYSRQELIKEVSPPPSVIIVGLGGIGSYVAIELAMVGTPRLVLIDNDFVEESNRNRVLFDQDQVGMMKVDAIRDNIYRLRKDVDVIAIPRRTDNLGVYVKYITKESMLIDCRDNVEEFPDYFPAPSIKAGYDGLEGTLHINPDYSSIMGSGGDAYRTVPSYAVSASYMAQLVTFYATIPSLRRKEECVCTFNMLEQFDRLLRSK